MRQKIIFSFLLLIPIILASCSEKIDSNLYNGTITVFKSETCSCCSVHSAYMDKSGLDVDVIPLTDMSGIKKDYNIPKSMESCHTTIIGEYFVEGHVPIEAIEKLLRERPDIDGIALPRMPSGSPGMPGCYYSTSGH
jgi:hypothetical protein